MGGNVDVVVYAQIVEPEVQVQEPLQDGTIILQFAILVINSVIRVIHVRYAGELTELLPIAKW